MTHDPNEMPEILGCPWCDKQPQWGLTKKTGCQMHGDPIQYVTLGCNNPKCEVKPHVTGGDRYSNGETGRFFVEGEKRARELAAKYWNKRADLAPTSQWLPIETYKDCFPVLVSRPPDGFISTPTTAFKDVTGVWRVYRSEGGNTPLPFEPTHWQYLPRPPTKDLAAAGKENV